jgi:hypothetical protein
VRQELFDAMLLLCCAYALWRGGAPERIASMTFLAADLMSVAVVSVIRQRFSHEEYGLFVTDLLMLVVLAMLSFRSTRWWPLVLAGLQLDGVLAHVMHLTAQQTIPIAYLNATALWSYPMLLILVAATWRHQARLKRWGEDRPWKTSARVRRLASVAGDS